MSIDWNKLRANYNGAFISWDNKDEIQRLLTVVQSDIVDAINTALEYRYVLDFTSDHLDYMNKAPQFWSEVIPALRVSLIMQIARLFDESKDAIGIKKTLNILEQSNYRDNISEDIKNIRQQYTAYHKYIEEIRELRDKKSAHNDKKEYQSWKWPATKDLEFEGEFWSKVDELLIWARDSLLLIRTKIGDGYPVNSEIENDVDGLLSIQLQDEK